MSGLTGATDPASQRLFAVLGDDAALLRSMDWADTPLGPVSGWPDELASAVRTVLPSRLPMLIWWGPELVQIYNEAFEPLLGDKHPAAMGQRASQCWPEVWTELGPLAERVLIGDGATLSRNFLLSCGAMDMSRRRTGRSPIVRLSTTTMRF